MDNKKIKPTIIDYIPLPVEEEKPESLKEFVDYQSHEQGERFEINKMVSDQIGLTKLKKDNYKNKFDNEVKKYVDTIKDGAYKESFELGRKEGLESGATEAEKKAREEITETLDSLKKLMSELGEYKKNFFEENSKQMSALCYFLVEKMVFTHVEKNDEFITRAISHMLSQQNIKYSYDVKISAESYKFIEENKNLIEVPMKTENIQFKEDDNLKAGDFIIENDYGALHGTLEERLEKMKSLFRDFS